MTLINVISKKKFDICIVHNFSIKLILIAAQADYNTRRAGITSAIVVAILIPVGICGFCLIVHLRQKATEKAYDKNPTNTIQRNTDTVENNSIVYKQGIIKEENNVQQNGSRKASKVHEGEYYTNEPLDRAI